ncbi:Scr1 family TA system antitoxin-like transcriptional regulator [Saccharothrix coeruleofusca]|uniref:DUF5753 domain-containing protein n=1 Tax=Saccharothrix coeruleofusca TaxID=33919 RepID=A0A918APL8_9PSEU|nr:Scr1 family TA system antitoxin-like transcriptional regulator [Saccharothrix coeruleofusca]MBP2337088.1 hypothetical protein [Saccharothrix coeruleofusca]GGP67239.1 hypothetical protein GCM10010185_45130 [Saccharothrix coeruleofusca]
MTTGETGAARLLGGLPGARAAVEAIDLIRLLGHGQQLALDERKADAVTCYEVLAVPAPLRTPEYAEVFDPAATPRSPTAPRYTFYLHEAALLTPVGGPAVMTAQLRALAESPWPVRVVPFTAGARPSLLRPFVYLEFADAPAVAYSGGRPEVAGEHRAALVELDRLAWDADRTRVELRGRAWSAR